MPTVQYGQQEIVFKHVVDDELTKAYVTVDSEEGVILKSPFVSDQKAQALVKSKASWILKKLKLVSHQPDSEPIQTGSRLLFLGKQYYTELIPDEDVTTAKAAFDSSRLRIYINPEHFENQELMHLAMAEFYMNMAHSKILPRIESWSHKTGLQPSNVIFQRLLKRWGSCTQQNKVIINSEAMKLPYSLIDYVIVHELCHIQVKEHSKRFWDLVKKHLPRYQELDEQINYFKL